ncbi:MAG TPA: glutamate--tRNA ligase [Actinomycetota bacterium]|nr:glutamate--tRNA ligase [Actinomycetota bacterium]
MVVRTRIAPAPSGSIHVGNARTALYNWLYARQHDGVFVLRVEDTDQSRVTEESYLAVLEDLRWLGLEWDEGPEVGGPHTPYRQSERTDRYARATDHLLKQGHAYLCYCTPEELAERRKAAQAARRAPGYDGRCRNLTENQRAAFEREGRASSVRFRVPEGRTVTVEDAVRGTVATETAQIPDFVIRRSDGSPTYMLAVTVDDVEMDITHIVRGEDLMAATPRQLLMREALGVEEVPVFGHLPLLVDEKGRPLSKRWGDVSVAAYREQGFLPEALVNYLALLGWSYDDHTNIFSVDELIEKFSLERVGKNPAAFDVNKLEWLNGHYIREKTPDEMVGLLVKVCAKARLNVDSEASRTKLLAVAPLITERMKRLTEAPPMIQFLFEDVVPDAKTAKVLEGQQDYLTEVARRLETLDEWSAASIEETLRSLAEERQLKPKHAFQPVRAAVTGTLISPPLFESLEILGRDKTLERLRRAAS